MRLTIRKNKTHSYQIKVYSKLTDEIFTVKGGKTLKESYNIYSDRFNSDNYNLIKIDLK